LSRSSTLAGAFGAVRELAEPALAEAREAGYGYGVRLGLILTARAHLGLGEREPARRALDAVTRPESDGHRTVDWILHLQLSLALAEYWLAAGAPGRASQAATRLCRLATPSGERTYLALGRQMLAEAALGSRRLERAEAEVSRALAVLRGADAPLAAWRVEATAARLRQQQGRAAEGARFLERSRTLRSRLVMAPVGVGAAARPVS
jgi:hypothetical protein